MEEKIKNQINHWLSKSFDQETRNEIVKLQKDNNINELHDRFYKNLDFGTGGLRAKMGAGTNRLNIYTIGIATQGLANYITAIGPKALNRGVAIAYDSRNNSHLYTMYAARVLAANKIKVYIFPELKPIALLSFAVRYFNSIAGIVITASHNPPIYNGYKVYWEDGAQITPPHDKNIINHVNEIKDHSSVKIIDEAHAFKDNLIEYIDKSIIRAYFDTISALSLNKKNNLHFHDMKIAYSPLHGSGITVVEDALSVFGFKNIVVVDSQKNPDGNFPTVKTPNPEEKNSMKEVINLAREENAFIAFATDPDGDRIGVASKNQKGEFCLFTGNQIGALLTFYILNQLKYHGKLNPEKDFIVKTIVTTDLITQIAKSYEIPCIEVLTGFKWIGLKIKELQDCGGKHFLFGAEESYGYLFGSHSRDKDAVIIAAIITEVTAWALSKDKTLFEILNDIYYEYGYFLEKLRSLTFEGFEGIKKIQNIINHLKNKTPEKIYDSPVKSLIDYNHGINGLPKSNVLLLTLTDGTKIYIRPSGTEPKIKFYFMTHTSQIDPEIEKTKKDTERKLDKIIDSFLSLVESF